MLSNGTLNKGKGKEVKISLSINRSRSSSATSTTSTLFDVDHVPDDIWLTIFEHLGPADLGNLSSTSRKFHALTQRPLLREITWAKAHSAARNVRDWAQGGSLHPFTGIVRKIKIRLSFKKINQNGALVSTVDWEFYDAVFHRLLSFANLRSLELVDTIFTPAIYPVLAAIPTLRELNITRCTFVWSPLYPAILSTLGRPSPPGGLPAPYEQPYTRASPLDIPAQRQWFLDNHSFDFAQELGHITHLTFKYNRTGAFSDDSARAAHHDLPHPTSEIGKPTILHPLYLLTLPGLTDLTLTWNSSLMHVYDTLKLPVNNAPPTQGGGIIPLGANGLPLPNAFHPHLGGHLANLLHTANPFGLNVFTPLRPAFPNLAHVTLLIDDLSRDLMDSVTTLFEQRVNSPAPGLGQLRTMLRVGKHSLTEQHLGSIQFKLQGVYHYDGPLQVAGLLTAGMTALNAVNAMEEIKMTEAMDMNLVLFTLEKLPHTIQTLHLRMFKWDQEILYAVSSLFKGIKELVIKYGTGALLENTHVTLGSDILPVLQQLHTLRILRSPDCIKRDQQRFPFGHHHLNGGGGGGNGGGGGGGNGGGGGFNHLAFPGGGLGHNQAHIHSNHGGSNLSGTWWAMTSRNATHPSTHMQNHHHHHHHHHHSFTTLDHTIEPPMLIESDEEDLDDIWAFPGFSADDIDDPTSLGSLLDGPQYPSGPSTGGGIYINDDAGPSDDTLSLTSTRLSAIARRDGRMAGPSSSSSSNAVAGPSSPSSNAVAGPSSSPSEDQSNAAAGSSSSGSRSNAVAGPSSAGSSSNAIASSSSGSGSSSSRSPSLFQQTWSRATRRAQFDMFHNHPVYRAGISNLNRRHRTTVGPSTSASTSASASTSTSVSASASTSTSGPSTTTTTRRSPSSFVSISPGYGSSSDSSPTTVSINTGRRNAVNRNNRRAAAQDSPVRVEPSDAEEQRRIAQSLREDLADYLVGWNRHCPRLRVVQMDHGVTWVRRFDGDVWTAVNET